MAIEDLDLEFEDEEEELRSDALEVDVDLTFSASPDTKLGQAAKSLQRKGAPQNRPTPKPMASKPTPKSNVTNINQAKTNSQLSRPTPQARPTQQTQPMNYANSEVSADVAMLKAEIAELKEQMQLVQHHADIRIAVAEAEKEYLVEYISNAKLLDHQVTQVLQKVSAKVPQLRGEMQGIKKYLREFLEKSKPKKGES